MLNGIKINALEGLDNRQGTALRKQVQKATRVTGKHHPCFTLIRFQKIRLYETNLFSIYENNYQ